MPNGDGATVYRDNRQPAGSKLHISVALVVSLLSLLASTHASILRTLTATVERVSDGDAITALTSEGTRLRLRLLGIDAPEIPHGKKPGQPYGEEARDYLNHLIGGKAVRMGQVPPLTLAIMPIGE